MSRNFLAALLMLVLLVVEGVLHARTTWVVDVGAVILAYLVLERPILGGAAMALLLGYLEDLRAGVPTGLYASATVLAFLVVRVGVAKIRWSGPVFSALVSLVSALVVLLWVVAIDGFLGQGRMSLRSALPTVPSLALSTIVLCYPVHRLFARIDERLARADDELILR